MIDLKSISDLNIYAFLASLLLNLVVRKEYMYLNMAHVNQNIAKR